jgi:hypothetical protein
MITCRPSERDMVRSLTGVQGDPRSWMPASNSQPARAALAALGSRYARDRRPGVMHQAATARRHLRPQKVHRGQRVVSFLSDLGRHIVSTADTVSKERWVSVVAECAGETLGIEVNGFPSRGYTDPARSHSPRTWPVGVVRKLDGALNQSRQGGRRCTRTLPVVVAHYGDHACCLAARSSLRRRV